MFDCDVLPGGPREDILVHLDKDLPDMPDSGPLARVVNFLEWRRIRQRARCGKWFYGLDKNEVRPAAVRPECLAGKRLGLAGKLQMISDQPGIVVNLAYRVAYGTLCRAFAQCVGRIPRSNGSSQAQAESKQKS